jgi:hypothetical protein
MAITITMGVFGTIKTFVGRKFPETGPLLAFVYVIGKVWLCTDLPSTKLVPKERERQRERIELKWKFQKGCGLDVVSMGHLAHFTSNSK